MRYLNVENAKTSKGEVLGILTGILYLAPALESGVMNTCVMATLGCMMSCLYTAGRASFDPSILEARIRRTKELFADRVAFIAALCHDIEALIRKAQREGLKPAVRLNGTSDLYWLVKAIAPRFPEVQFYDYTKLPKPWLRELPNYHLTFSFSESNWNDASECLARGYNVAVPFQVKRGKPLPEQWRGYQVIDGDKHDVRFLDGHQSVIIGLRAKGRGKKDQTGFVQNPAPQVLLHQVGAPAQWVTA